jgi:SAM-dependent methyltransferase
MGLADHYHRQRAWRDWPRIFDALPPPRGQTILDLGCGVGDQAAELLQRGAGRVIGFDMLEEVLDAARARSLPGAEFRTADLRAPLEAGVPADGLWSSFGAAYFPGLADTLADWGRSLRPGGWIALTEIDDLFGHEPLSARAKGMFEGYARDALLSKRYDFHMGRKLADHLRQAGFTVAKTMDVPDRELAFDGAALPEVVEAWRARFDYMRLFRDFCGPDFAEVRDEFLACLARVDHRSTARVCFCLATR